MPLINGGETNLFGRGVREMGKDSMRVFHADPKQDKSDRQVLTT